MSKKKKEYRPKRADRSYGSDRPKRVNKSEEFRVCDKPGCANVVSVADKPRYAGPIYCVLHRESESHGRFSENGNGTYSSSASLPRVQ